MGNTVLIELVAAVVQVHANQQDPIVGLRLATLKMTVVID